MSLSLLLNDLNSKSIFPKKDVESLLDYFDEYGKLVKVKSDIKVCRDEKDNFLLNLSIDSKADYLITGDNDLLVLEKIGHAKIVDFSNFMSLI